MCASVDVQLPCRAMVASGGRVSEIEIDYPEQQVAQSPLFAFRDHAIFATNTHLNELDLSTNRVTRSVEMPLRYLGFDVPTFGSMLTAYDPNGQRGPAGFVNWNDPKSAMLAFGKEVDGFRFNSIRMVPHPTEPRFLALVPESRRSHVIDCDFLRNHCETLYVQAEGPGFRTRAIAFNYLDDGRSVLAVVHEDLNPPVARGLVFILDPLHHDRVKVSHSFVLPPAPQYIGPLQLRVSSLSNTAALTTIHAPPPGMDKQPVAVIDIMQIPPRNTAMPDEAVETQISNRASVRLLERNTNPRADFHEHSLVTSAFPQDLVPPPVTEPLIAWGRDKKLIVVDASGTMKIVNARPPTQQDSFQVGEVIQAIGLHQPSAPMALEVSPYGDYYAIGYENGVVAVTPARGGGELGFEIPSLGGTIMKLSFVQKGSETPFLLASVLDSRKIRYFRIQIAN